MWIKWKYNDHGCSGFTELEVPDDFGGEESVEDYICELGLVPTWSERFMISRIKWEKLKLPSKEYVQKQILDLQSSVKWRKGKIKQLKELLEKL